MVTDELGEHDENEIPSNLVLPLKIDLYNEALTGADGFVLARHAFSSETAMVIFARRRMEFVVRLANGEIVVSNGTVLKKAGEIWQDGQLVVTYVPLGHFEIFKHRAEVETDTKEIGTADISSLSKTDQRKHQTLLKRLNRLIEKARIKKAESGIAKNGDESQ